MRRLHQAADALDAIVDVAIGARLGAIAPDFYLASICRQCHFATNSRRGFFASAVVRTERTENIMETRDARFQAVVLVVVTTLTLAEEFFPAIAVFRVSRIRIFFLQRRHI